jgi:hypothetical protein
VEDIGRLCEVLYYKILASQAIEKKLIFRRITEGLV